MRYPTLACAFACALSACGQAPGGVNAAGRAGPSQGSERGYVSPPAVTGARRLSAGRTLLVGSAPPSAKVRLASPGGDAVFALAGASGVWRIVLPSAESVRLFGLSYSHTDRPIQAEGYVAVTPGGLAAQLRAGSGAVVMDGRGAGVAIQAADFDRKGGLVLSGTAPAGQAVAITVDGSARGPARADAQGRFTVALNEPLKPGDHVLGAAAVGGRDSAGLTISPAQKLTAGPFLAGRAAGGWRLDWLTPGGGVQSTVLFDSK